MPILILLVVAVCVVGVALVFVKRSRAIVVALGLLAIGYLVLSHVRGERAIEVVRLNDHVEGGIFFAAHNPLFGGSDGYLVLKLTDSATGKTVSKHLVSGYNLRNTAKVRIVTAGAGRAKIFEDTMQKAWEVSDSLEIRPSTWTKI
jgi:hypothetical protein